MTLQQVYFSFDGRIGRRTFWLKGVLLLGVIEIALIIVAANFGVVATGGWLVLIMVLAAIWPNLAVQVKRWHDRDKSGWWVLTGLIPIIGGIWTFIEVGLLKGTEGPNRFGAETF